MRSGERVKAAARRLRREMSPPETRLWMRLRRLDDGYPRFRRQHPFGPFVLDFYCPAAKLCVEVEGWSHDMGDQPARDGRRDAWLAVQGVEVLRIAASEVMADLDEVAWFLIRTAVERAKPPPPLRRGGV